MGIAPIAAIGPAIVPAMPVYAASITPASVQAAAVPRTTAPNAIDGAYYLVSGPALPTGTGATRLEQDLMKAALLVGLLGDDDEKKKQSSVLDLIIAAAVLKIYEQMSALGTTSSVGFVGDGAGGAVGLSVSVKA
jgi:hypothetical protein